MLAARPRSCLPLALALLGTVAACESFPSPATPTAERTIVFLGTPHGQLLKFAGYRFAHVRAAYDAVSPDLVCVEIRPEPFARGELGDGPLEMTYLTCVARENGVPVEGIDWWTESTSFADLDRSTEEAIEKDLQGVSLPFPPTYDEARSEAYATASLRVHDVRVRYAGDAAAGDWMRRNLWMVQRVREAMARHPGARRVLVAVGCEHTAIMRQMLSGEPFAIQLAPPVTPVPSVAARASDACLREWERSVASLGSQIAALGERDPLRERLGQKVAVLRRAIQRRGLLEGE
jgi:hypothetical protein